MKNRNDYTQDIISLYEKSNTDQIAELNKIIIALKTKVNYLEKKIEEYEKVPIPKPIVEQILQLEAKNRKLQNDIAYYKNHVQPQVIINKENKEKPTRRGGIPK
jgi:hypothetical protein